MKKDTAVLVSAFLLNFAFGVFNFGRGDKIGVICGIFNWGSALYTYTVLTRKDGLWFDKSGIDRI